MIKTAIALTRDRARVAEIGRVATDFGLDVLLARFGLAHAADDSADSPLQLPDRTRRAMEALGPTFVKLGQILATRRDLLPPAWIEEFEKLHSRAPTVPFDTLRPDVERALGAPPEDIFASFDPIPLAAASIAQVHRARLADGREVVLKIRRAGIRTGIEADLRLIAHFARVAEAASAEARRLAPTALVAQLARDMLEELDFTNEGRNADRLREDFDGDGRIVIPSIHWPLSSDGLLVMDYVAGVAPTSGEALRDAGIDPRAIAELGADVVLDMLLLNGRFHGDPHPGNLLCLPGNRLALLDLGSVGHVSTRRRAEFLSFVQALIAGDAATVAETLLLWSGPGGPPRERIQRAADRIVARHGGGPLVLSVLVVDLFPLLREEGLLLPPDLLLIFKALITIDGVLNAVAPGFDLAAAVGRARSRILMSRLTADRATNIVTLLAEVDRIADDVPRLLRALVRRIDAPIEPDAGHEITASAIRSAGRWIALAVLAAGAAIVAAMLA